MCSAGLLLWKNQKSSTCYPMILCKRDFFFKNIQIFFRQAISQNSSKPLIVKDFYLLRMSNNFFRRAAQGQLLQRNRRNTATVLIAVVKSHNCLKGAKVFACECLEEISNIFHNLQGRARAGCSM